MTQEMNSVTPVISSTYVALVNHGRLPLDFPSPHGDNTAWLNAVAPWGERLSQDAIAVTP